MTILEVMVSSKNKEARGYSNHLYHYWCPASHAQSFSCSLLPFKLNKNRCHGNLSWLTFESVLSLALPWHAVMIMYMISKTQMLGLVKWPAKKTHAKLEPEELKAPAFFHLSILHAVDCHQDVDHVLMNVLEKIHYLEISNQLRFLSGNLWSSCS